MKTADRIRLAIIEVWADGRMPNTYQIAKATRNLGAKEPVAANTVSRMVKRWALAGEADLQTNALRQGSAPWIFSWGPDDATAKHALLAAIDTFSQAQTRRLSTAMRHYLELPPRITPLEKILTAAEAIPASELFGLPDRVARSAVDAGLSDSTIGPWRSVVKAALRAAAEVGAVPVVFPRYHIEDEWEAACQRWFFHAEADGTAPKTRQAYASTVLRIRSALDGLELDRCPSSLTQSDLEDHIYPYARSRMGSPSWMRALRTALRYVGRIHGEGPYADLHGEGRHGSCDGYLSVPRGKSGDLDAIILAMKESGFHSDVLEFLGWYEDYSLLPDADLWGALSLDDSPAQFPTRPHNRHLTTRTWGHRLLALRAFAQHAVQVCEEHNLPLDLPNVFGRAGVRILKEIERWWQKRADQGEVVSAHTTGIESLIVQAGMIARALYDRSIHLQGVEVTDGSGEALRGSSLDATTARATRSVHAYLATYRHAQARSGYFEACRKKSSDGYRKTDRKCIRTIYEKTPPSFWASVGRAMQQQITNWDGKRGYMFYLLVRNAFVHGLILSTGCRGSGLAWLTISKGGGYGPENHDARRIDWEAWKRKNNRANSAFLRETFLPHWLERLYLEEARPFFIERGIKNGDLTDNHNLLIVHSATGNSLSKGWWPSDANDYMQTGARTKKGIAQLAASWRSSASRAAAEIGLDWPDRYGEGGLHAMRNAMASGIYRLKGKESAADYLGDSVGTVEDTYAAVDGCHVDPSELERELVEDIAASGVDSGDLGIRLKELERENQRLKELLADRES